MSGSALRPRVVAGAAAALLITTGGPSVQIARHLGERGATASGWEGWLRLYPYGAVAVAGLIGCTRWLAPIPWRRWPWPVWPVLGYVVWALCSAAWTVSPSTTPARALTGVGIAAFGLWFGARVRPAEQIWSVTVAACVAVVASAVVVAVYPDWGTMPVRANGTMGGEWQGIFGNRNGLAPICVMGLIGLAAVVALRPSLRRGAWAGAFAILHLVVLRASGGITSLLALGLAVGTAAVVLAVWWLKRRGAPGWAVGGGLGAVVTVAATVVVVNLDSLATKVGRDPTLTGRRWIWDDMGAFIDERPWRGYGFWAFWERPDLTAATYARLEKPYGSAHNSAVEVLLGLGVVGLVLYLAVVLAAVAGVSALVWRGRSVFAWFWALMLASLIVQNLMESFVLWHSYNWILCIAATVVAFQVPLLQRASAPAAPASTDDAP